MSGKVQRNLSPVRRSRPGRSLYAAKGQSPDADYIRVWRLAGFQRQFGEVIRGDETQAASVASVSAAMGSFEDFTSVA